MVIFLTSSFFQNEPVGEHNLKPLSNANGFIEQLRKYWKENARFLIFASDPSDEELAKNITSETEFAFSVSEFSISEIRCFNHKSIENYRLQKGCDYQTAAKEALKEALEWADVFYLSGGHTPTEMLS